MRKHLVWILAVAIAASAVGVAWAGDTATSNVKMKIKPTKLSKKKFKGIKLGVETSTLNNANPGTPTKPASVPTATTKVKLTFDKDIKFTTKGLAQCKANLEGTTTDQAKSKCKKAQVGTGSATVCVGATGAACDSGNTFSANVTAFNGKPKGDKSTIVLHSRVDALSLTTVLVGTLNPKKNTLDVPVPALPSTTITDFKTTVEKSYKAKVHGKKKTFNYASAKCSHKKLTLKGKFVYSDGESTDTPSTKAKCST